MLASPSCDWFSVRSIVWVVACPRRMCVRARRVMGVGGRPPVPAISQKALRAFALSELTQLQLCRSCTFHGGDGAYLFPSSSGDRRCELLTGVKKKLIIYHLSRTYAYLAIRLCA